MQENLDDVIRWIRLIFPELSEDEVAEKAKHYAVVLAAVSADLQTFQPSPRIAHATDNRQVKPL